MPDREFTTYVLEYSYKGNRCGFNMRAENEEDLRERLRRLPYAQVLGTDPTFIPDYSPAFLFVPLYVRLRNWVDRVLKILRETRSC